MAPDLESGAAWVGERLGAAPGPGGKHPRMGTHNRLLRLGDDVYLEVIAVDPEALPPGRPRWFGLDRPVPEPRLATWVARTSNIAGAPWPAEEMTRGALRWRIAFAPDGSLALGGLLPAWIEWPGEHPARAMPDAGFRLASLEILTPDPRSVGALRAVPGLVVRKQGERGLRASIETPKNGVRILSSALPPATSA